MKTVLFFTDIHTGVHAAEYAGVCDRARHYGWRVVEIEYARTDRPAEEFIAEWNPCGVIVECGNLIGEVDVPAYTSVPAVFIDPRLPASCAGRWMQASISLFRWVRRLKRLAWRTRRNAA